MEAKRGERGRESPSEARVEGSGSREHRTDLEGAVKAKTAFGKTDYPWKANTAPSEGELKARKVVGTLKE